MFVKIHWAAPPRFYLLFITTTLAICVLLLAFALSLKAASRQFEHALIAQRQAVLVEGIARDADSVNAGALSQSLETYRGLIQEEGQFLAGGERQRQAAEISRAAQLSALARVPQERGRLAVMVRAIAQEEQKEIATARSDLYQIRQDTIALGVLLALGAIGATSIGAIQLHRSNRDLASEVMARTAELRAIDQSRRLFFAKASHELRTPVTAIRALAEVALVHGGNAVPTLTDIVAQTDFLGHRIEDMLALSNAAEGRPQMVPVPCDVREVLDAAIAQAQPYARSIAVTMACSQPATPILACIDRRWLTQAVLAIIDNGLKFSDPDAALEVAHAALAQEVLITISDSGPGILPRDLPRIFDAYYQSDAGKTRGGTGLGLALARWVVEQHGGTIHAENRERGGCRIVISLPTIHKGIT